MRRLLVLVPFGAVLLGWGALACGPGSDKPPLTPDQEHPPAEVSDGGAPAPEPPNPVAQ